MTIHSIKVIGKSPAFSVLSGFEFHGRVIHLTARLRHASVEFSASMSAFDDGTNATEPVISACGLTESRDGLSASAQVSTALCCVLYAELARALCEEKQEQPTCEYCGHEIPFDDIEDWFDAEGEMPSACSICAEAHEGEFSAAPTEQAGVVCEVCGRAIPQADIAAYQAEAGDGSLPACCDDCAEPMVCDCVRLRETNTSYPDGRLAVAADPACPKCGGMADCHPDDLK